VSASTGTLFITTYADREAWLQAAINALRPKFAEAGHPLADVIRVSCGFGLSLRGENASILGQSFRPETTSDKVTNVFVSPLVDNAVQALGILVHELVHCADYNDQGEGGHDKAFAEIGAKVGLNVEKPTVALPGVALEAELVALAEVLGDYPHTAIELGARTVVVETPQGERRTVRAHTGPARQAARNLKVECQHGGRHHVRTTRGMVADVGMPSCACHGEPMDWA
jgi:hypothetical protein